MKIMARFGSIVLASVLLIACALGPRTAALEPSAHIGITFKEFPIPWSFDCSFPEKMKSDVRYGFKFWDDKTDLNLFEETDGCDMTDMSWGITIKLTPGIYRDHGSGELRDTVLAAASRSFSNGLVTGGVIRFYNRWLWEDAIPLKRNTAAHEVGHILGFGHSEEKECIMYENITDGTMRYDIRFKIACGHEIKEFLNHYSGK